MDVKRLTDEEKNFIYKNCEKLTVDKIAKKLNRSFESINSFMTRNKINRLLKSEIIYPYSLSEREVEVLSLIARGYSNTEIVEKLFISLSTVLTHINRIYQKLQISIYKRDGFSTLRVRAVLKYQEMVKDGLLDEMEL